MKIRAMLPFLLLATFSAAHADATSDALAGHWRGAWGSGPAQNVMELQFDRSAAGYRGHVWVAIPAGTSLPVSDVQPGPRVRFAVPSIGLFEGEIHGGLLEGTFTGAGGSEPILLRKEPGPNDLQFVD
ncbi:MAG: hypothetical protein ACXWLR_10710 [Myxococcales bacterium]